MSESLHLFVDGSFAKVNNEIHAGIVLIKNNQIICESYCSTKDLHEAKEPHEEFAVIVGLNLISQIENVKEINLYSDSQSLVELLNKKEKIESTKLYKTKKPFIKKIIKLQNNLLNSNVNLKIHWTTDGHTYGLKRAHNISRKWNDKEPKLMPFIIDENIKINYGPQIKIINILSNHLKTNKNQNIKKPKNFNKKSKSRCPQYGLNR